MVSRSPSIAWSTSKTRGASLLAGMTQSRPWCAPSPTLTTFGALPLAERVQDPLNTALSAYRTLSSTNVLAQSLGGLNNALLMRQQIPQLPVFDLNAMLLSMGSVTASEQEYKELARDVAAAVAGGNNSSPVTDTDFLPIRSGLMKVNKLYLVDTFGQVLDVSPATILPSDTLTISRNVTAAVKPKITPEQDAGYRLPRAARRASRPAEFPLAGRRPGRAQQPGRAGDERPPGDLAGVRLAHPQPP